MFSLASLEFEWGKFVPVNYSSDTCVGCASGWIIYGNNALARYHGFLCVRGGWKKIFGTKIFASVTVEISWPRTSFALIDELLSFFDDSCPTLVFLSPVLIRLGFGNFVHESFSE